MTSGTHRSPNQHPPCLHWVCLACSPASPALIALSYLGSREPASSQDPPTLSRVSAVRLMLGGWSITAVRVEHEGHQHSLCMKLSGTSSSHHAPLSSTSVKCSHDMNIQSPPLSHPLACAFSRSRRRRRVVEEPSAFSHCFLVLFLLLFSMSMSKATRPESALHRSSGWISTDFVIRLESIFSEVGPRPSACIESDVAVLHCHGGEQQSATTSEHRCCQFDPATTWQPCTSAFSFPTCIHNNNLSAV